MNILINFRYISTGPVKKSIINQVQNSEELNSIIDNFYDIAYCLKNDCETIEELKSNTELLDKIKGMVFKTVNADLEKFNSRVDLDCYLWIDEICSVLVKSNKAYPLENEHDYANFHDVKKTIQSAVIAIAKKDDSFTLDEYCDLFMLVYIDIIERLKPSFILFPKSKN